MGKIIPSFATFVVICRFFTENKDLKRIVITGPESTGKSSLAKYLGEYFNCPYTDEQARKYLNNLIRPYQYEDLEAIGRLQVNTEENQNDPEKPFLFCDTDLITIKIWSDYRFGKTALWILQQIEQRHYDYYLLCRPDIPWEADPLRENPHDREELFQLHREILEYYNKQYAIVEGMGEERMEMAVSLIDQLL